MMSKRQFLKLGLSGGTAAFLAPLLGPVSLLGNTFQLPAAYLQSRVHAYWMKLSHHSRGETRRIRRALGATLRNLGGQRGRGRGYSFVSIFDQAVVAVYQRCQATGTRPGSLFALIQMIYDDYVYPRTGVEGGRILFACLLSALRGRDGSAGGEAAYQSYLNFRQATLAHKNSYQQLNDPAARAEAAKRRLVLLQEWQRNLHALVELYAQRQAALNPQFLVRSDMLEGVHISHSPEVASAPRLILRRSGGKLTISWSGPGTLQQAPTPLGPWADTQQPSPASFDASAPQQFFRAIQITK